MDVSLVLLVFVTSWLCGVVVAVIDSALGGR
jgi:hypothetical protein